MAVELSETKRVRDYIDGKLPAYVRDDAIKAETIKTPSYYDAAGGGAAPDEEENGGAAKKVSQWLDRVLEGFKADAANGGTLHWSGMANDLARRHLDFASLALSLEALFTTNKLPSSAKVSRSASSIFTSLSPTLALKKWSPAERAHLLAGLGPVLVSLPPRRTVEYPVLLDPTHSSEISADLIPRRSSSLLFRNTVDFNSLEISHLRTLWKLDGVSTALDEILTAFRFILSEATESPTTAAGSSASYAATQSGNGGATQASQRIKELEQTQAADDFGEVRISSRATFWVPLEEGAEEEEEKQLSAVEPEGRSRLAPERLSSFPAFVASSPPNSPLPALPVPSASKKSSMSSSPPRPAAAKEFLSPPPSSPPPSPASSGSDSLKPKHSFSISARTSFPTTGTRGTSALRRRR
jgi:hypothetical protein